MIKSIYHQTIVLGNEFLNDTGNLYRVVSQRKYIDKKGKLKSGYVFTLQIINDYREYNENEDDMTMQTFNAYVLCGEKELKLKKGDYCELHDFLEESSYYIDFNYILRFGGIQKIDEKQLQKSETK